MLLDKLTNRRKKRYEDIALDYSDIQRFERLKKKKKREEGVECMVSQRLNEKKKKKIFQEGEVD